MNEPKAGAEPAPPDNVVALGNDIIRTGEVTELERQRKVMFRAFELTAGQLEHDATELTLRAVMVPDLETEKREHMVHTAFMLRESAGWIRTMLLPTKGAPPDAGPA